ncbi:MAG: hypothetical protein M4579_002761 [Chaenotheca gracillima]|nr:MAG: hypothetical protein M4579_002761 [Chaenotheca gracillima]
MDDTGTTQAVVDPEVQAYVFSLVSALGGTGADDGGQYVLGDDALACLKDLKRWLKLYDEKTNRMDVARCLAEANLVNGDLVPILASWPEDATEDRVKSKIALACLELLVPLTWPIEKSDLQITVNHHRHIPYLQLAQVSYKRGILNHDTAKLLGSAVRIALPSMAEPLNERSNRDEGIIKLALYYFRNIALISVPPKAQAEGDENEVSRSATIDAFHYQQIFHLLLTMSSSMGDDFSSQDVVVMEVLFHLLKGIETERLFMNETQIDASKTDELRTLLNKEAGMLRGYARSAPTRHNRFGTMIWVKRDDDRVSTVSGQDVLLDSQRSLAKIDKTKRWKKPKQRSKITGLVQNEFDNPVKLTGSARKHLRKFVEDFLDAGFNPLFNHIRRAMDREADRVLDIHSRQFFFLVAWFLEAERQRRKAAKADRESRGKDQEADSFAIVASVLTQETFIALNRFMQESYDMKEWQDLNAGMRCFTQILLTVQEMSESPLEEDHTIAENIQNRIFYEETTHDRIVTIVQYYSNQGFGYLNSCTELAHVYLRMLERYAKQNVEMQVRSRRRAKRKSKAKKGPDAGTSNKDQDDEEEDEGEELAQAQRTSRERKFDFHRFAARFMRQGCIDTFVALTRYYNDLSVEQLKRAHRFFHRAAFKMEMGVMLFRVDIIALFNKMIKGPEGLDPASTAFREWQELVQHIFRQLVKKMDQRPQMAIEMLFSKIQSTVYFLEHGFDQRVETKAPRIPAELEIKPGMEKMQQIGVGVSYLCEKGFEAMLKWVISVLTSAIDERKAWEDEAAAQKMVLESSEHEVPAPDESSPPPTIFVKPDDLVQTTTMNVNQSLRLLMSLVGFERLGIDDDVGAAWVIPSSVTSSDLREALEAIEKFRVDPMVFDDDKTAKDLVRRKSAGYHKRAAYDDDSEGDLDDDEMLFPEGGPTIAKGNPLEELKKRRRRRRHTANSESEGEGLNDEERERRAEARRKANLEKRRKIKSDLFVHDSDEDENDEKDRDFFEKEEQRRKDYDKKVLQALSLNRMSGKTDRAGGTSKAKKRKTQSLESSDSDSKKRRRTTIGIGSQTSDSDRGDTEDDQGLLRVGPSSVAAYSDPISLIESDKDTEHETDTPLSSPPAISSTRRQKGSSLENATSKSVNFSSPTGSPVTTEAQAASNTNIARDVTMVDSGNDDDEDDQMPISQPMRRGRARGGFVIESDSDE